MQVIMKIQVLDGDKVYVDEVEVSGSPTILNNLPYGKMYSNLADGVVGQACVEHALAELEKNSE